MLAAKHLGGFVQDLGFARHEFLNFRDLGGTTAVDGRQLRLGKLARSGAFDDLSPEGADRLRDLGFTSVVDLRSAAEQEQHPSALIASGLSALVPPPQSTPAEALRMIGAPGVRTEEVHQAMTGVYRSGAEDFAVPFRHMFEALLTRPQGILVHCAIGKDRTGMAVALLLAALRVDRAVILSDYLATNNARGDIVATMAARFPRRHHLSPEVVAPLLAADPLYIHAFWDHLDREYGGELGYLSARLGVKPKDLVDLQAEWLEGPLER